MNTNPDGSINYHNPNRDVSRYRNIFAEIPSASIPQGPPVSQVPQVSQIPHLVSQHGPQPIPLSAQAPNMIPMSVNVSLLNQSTQQNQPNQHNQQTHQSQHNQQSQLYLLSLSLTSLVSPAYSQSFNYSQTELLKPDSKKACTRCRNKKIKCSSEIPVCTNCSKHDVDCDIMDCISYNFDTVRSLQSEIAGLQSSLSEYQKKYNQSEQNLSQTKSQLNYTKSQLDYTKSQLDYTKSELDKKDKIIQSLQSTQSTQSIQSNNHKHNHDHDHNQTLSPTVITNVNRPNKSTHNIASIAGILNTSEDVNFNHNLIHKNSNNNNTHSTHNNSISNLINNTNNTKNTLINNSITPSSQQSSYTYSQPLSNQHSQQNLQSHSYQQPQPQPQSQSRSQFHSQSSYEPSNRPIHSQLNQNQNNQNNQNNISLPSLSQSQSQSQPISLIQSQPQNQNQPLTTFYQNNPQNSGNNSTANHSTSTINQNNYNNPPLTAETTIISTQSNSIDNVPLLINDDSLNLMPSPNTQNQIQSQSQSQIQIQKNNETINKISSEVGNLLFQCNGQCNYAGNTAGAVFLKIFFNTINIDYLNENDIKFEDSHLNLNTKENYTYASNYAPLPDKSLSKYLLLRYIEKVHIYYPFSNISELRDYFEKIYQDPKKMSSFEKSYVFMILAISSELNQYAKDYKKFLNMFNPEDYFNTALKFFTSKDHYLKKDENLIKMLLLLSIWYIYTNNNDNIWLVTKLNVALGVELGIHRYSRDWKLSTLTIESRNRLWWCIYSLERFVTVNLGRTLGIKNQSVDCNSPTAKEFDELLSVEQSIAPIYNNIKINAAILMFNLRKIGGDIMESVYIPRPESRPSLGIEIITRVSNDLRTKLSNWLISVEQCIPKDSFTYYDLKVQFHLYSLLLNRPSTSFPAPNEQITKLCWENCLSVIDCWLYLINNNCLHKTWGLLHDIIMVDFVSLYCSYKTVHDFALTKKLIDDSFKVLDHFFQDDIKATRFKVIITKLINNYDKINGDLTEYSSILSIETDDEVDWLKDALGGDFGSDLVDWLDDCYAFSAIKAA
ncbi:uncharacterized protein ASCRUDRAFT_77245 [Ascoidea rubescens DSM 1968]|uniref:Zn(2)-C6 fungal-type domain-containing protein n=1 Tax=Ascoidea rubescens DSM 1968 TaxID=1344418 RepID=A0A1D2VC08_9ASCO|nr:hypothetical protein ASCRUDRAFT_77245 [Ascoidea rubescens DSM 1968]ODV59151.1 hypothetical protein ASCRUDRAFT_77245 [Ascoidea rubescens DSM 1968]